MTMEAQPTAATKRYTTEQVATMVKASPKTVRRQVRAKGVPVGRLGREMRFSDDDVAALLAPPKPAAQPAPTTTEQQPAEVKP